MITAKQELTASYFRSGGTKIAKSTGNFLLKLYRSNRKAILLSAYVITLAVLGTMSFDWLLSNIRNSMFYVDLNEYDWFLARAYNKYIMGSAAGLFGGLLAGVSILKGLQDGRGDPLSFSVGAFVIIGVTMYFFLFTGIAMLVLYLCTKEAVRITFYK